MRRSLIVGLLFTTIIGSAIFYWDSRSSALAPVENEYQAAVRLWQDRFQSLGTADAYVVFVQEGSTETSDKSHTLAHIVGAVLYDQERTKGIAYCTDAFNFGCYHGFAGRFIEQQGINDIPILLKTCETLSIAGDCEHGIGHGILAYYGDDRLHEALEMCPPTYHGDEVSGCRNGIFMELFLNTARKSERQHTRPYDSLNPEGPCPTVALKYRAACYYAITTWWRAWVARTEDDVSAQFKKVATMCQAVRDASMRAICFTGMGGQVAVSALFDAERVAYVCAQMPPEGRDLCLNEATATIRAMGTAL